VTRAGLKAAGMDLDFWRIAMRPGRPMAFGRLGTMMVLGLPGNPVSSFVCGLVFLQPLLAALQGLPPRDAAEPAILGADIPANDGRTAYLRARLEAREDGLARVYPLPGQDSSLLSVLAAADCLLVRPVGEPPQSAGSACRIIRLT
jgi:molybdopterin molybdotransferase